MPVKQVHPKILKFYLCGDSGLQSTLCNIEHYFGSYTAQHGCTGSWNKLREPVTVVEVLVFNEDSIEEIASDAFLIAKEHGRIAAQEVVLLSVCGIFMEVRQ